MSLVELWFDEYGHRDSPLHRWEPRCKLVGLLSLAFAFSYVRDLRLLPAMLVVALALYALSRLPFFFLESRLRYPSIFMLLTILALSLGSGSTELLRLGPLVLRQEGMLAALPIAARFFAILTIGLALFGSAPLTTTIKAMRALGLPDLLVDMTLLAYRYLYDIGADLSKMRRAMRLRGYDGHRLRKRSLDGLGSLLGSLLVRSHERSERVYEAMILRGYGQKPRPAAASQARRSDWLALAGALLLALGFVVAQITL